MKKFQNWMSLTAASLLILSALVPVEAAPKKGVQGASSKVSVVKVVNGEHPQYEYFQVTLDFSSAPTSKQEHYAVGKAYGEQIKKVEPGYEKHVDGYFNWLESKIPGSYEAFLVRVKAIRPQVPELYRAEIDGIADAMSGGTTNKAGDGKVSRDELYALNLLADIARITQCSAFGVDGERTDTGKTILGRNLDWTDGDDKSGHHLSKIHAAITVKNGATKNSDLLFGFLGYQAWCSGLTNNGIFAAILDSPTGAMYPLVPTGMRSYSMDLRTLMESSAQKESVASGIMGIAKQQKYCFNHLILMGDKKQATIVENNYSGYRKGVPAVFKPAVRVWDSPMHDDNDRPVALSAHPAALKWPAPHTIGTVNSFLMLGHQDNQNYPVGPIGHVPTPVSTIRDEGGNEKNTKRLQLMLEKVKAHETTGKKYSAAAVEKITSAHTNRPPGPLESGDLYNDKTIQTFIVQFGDERSKTNVRAFFKPAQNELEKDPLFVEVPLQW